MTASLADRRGPRFWLPLVAAVSIATFLAGIVAGTDLSTRSLAQGLTSSRGVAVSGAGAVSVAGALQGRPAVVVPSHSLTAPQWEALYGPTAATWGAWKVAPHSLTATQWEALYGPTAATWGVWANREGRPRAP